LRLITLFNSQLSISVLKPYFLFFYSFLVCFLIRINKKIREENLGIIDNSLKSLIFIFWVTLESFSVWSRENNHGRWCKFRAKGSLLRGEWSGYQWSCQQVCGSFTFLKKNYFIILFLIYAFDFWGCKLPSLA